MNVKHLFLYKYFAFNINYIFEQFITKFITFIICFIIA